MAEYFSSGTVGQIQNTTRQIEQKILTALNAGGGTPASSTSLSGVGSPAGVVSAPAGATYLDTSGNHFWAKASGSGTAGWVLLLN